MNIIFMGTPDFAVPCLERLIDCKHNILSVFSQPDKPVGRKQVLTAPPIKVCAESHNIPVYQPISLKDESVVKSIEAMGADVIVVVAYGKILPLQILNAAKYGCINVHASLLPKYRGAAPIQWSILNGDVETGVSIMQMDEGLDTGDILLVKKTPIDIDETSEMLFDRLSLIGADALIECLDKIENSQISPIKQSDVGSCYAEKITKKLSEIDWNDSAVKIHNQVRGLQTWPCATTKIYGKEVKIHKTVLSNKTGNKPGEVVDNKKVLTVSCGDGKCISILEVQPQGKNRMDSSSFLNGNNISLSTVIGE